MALLPAEIEATTENGTETLSLDSWSCDDYPAEGAYTGSYAFHAVLPEGYGLAADAPALTVTVELDDEVMLMAEGQHSHCICGAEHRNICEHKREASVSFEKKLSCSTTNQPLEINGKTITPEKLMVATIMFCLRAAIIWKTMYTLTILFLSRGVRLISA